MHRRYTENLRIAEQMQSPRDNVGAGDSACPDPQNCVLIWEVRTKEAQGQQPKLGELSGCSHR